MHAKRNTLHPYTNTHIQRKRGKEERAPWKTFHSQIHISFAVQQINNTRTELKIWYFCLSSNRSRSKCSNIVGKEKSKNERKRKQVEKNTSAHIQQLFIYIWWKAYYFVRDGVAVTVVDDDDDVNVPRIDKLLLALDFYQFFKQINGFSRKRDLLNQNLQNK